MFPEKTNEVFRRLYKKNPDPKTELVYVSPFELLVAVILSAQSTDKSVNKATARLFTVANTPKAIYALGTARILDFIKDIGLYNSKSKYLVETSRLLIFKHNSQVPGTREELEELPGVGRKTANVILNVIFNKRTIAVDTHVFRVSKRIGIAEGKNVLEVEESLMNRVPNKYLLKAHNWLIEHGRTLCRSRNPSCESCHIQDICRYNQRVTS